MVYTKYKFTPPDIAIYLLLSDFPYKKRNEIIEDLFKNHNDSIVLPYRSDFLQLRSAVTDLIIRWDSDPETMNEAEMILQELNESAPSENGYEPDCFGTYFKIIKLKLMYSEVPYRKIKLRTLLKDFGYKRRTPELIKSINNALNALELVPYLKGYNDCDLYNIKLDDMIMIRLGVDKTSDFQNKQQIPNIKE